MDRKYVIENDAFGTIIGTKEQIDFIMSSINNKACHYWNLAIEDPENKEFWEEEALKITHIYCDIFYQREAQK